MKILFFVDRLRRGGIQTLLYNLTVELTKKADVQIDYLLFEDIPAPNYEQDMISMGCNIFKVPKPTNLSSFFKCCNGLNVFFRKNNKYDVIHAHTSTKAVLPLYYAWKYGIKLRIEHSHCTSFQTTNPIALFIGNLLKAPVCRLANDYFACTELAGDWLFDNPFARKDVKVKVLNNAIPLSKYQYDPVIRKQLRNELGIDDETTVIGNVGRFMRQKNHKFLIDVFCDYHKRINNKSKLVLVGRGDLIDNIKEQVKLLDIEDSVLFTGLRKDVDRFYQIFDLFLMPSLFEGLPFVGIEAQTSGLPCLFSDTITSKVKVLGKTRFLSLDDPASEWAENIEQMLLNDIRGDVSEELSAAGYNIEIESEKLYNYYKGKI